MLLTGGRSKYIVLRAALDVALGRVIVLSLLRLPIIRDMAVPCEPIICSRQTMLMDFLTGRKSRRKIVVNTSGRGGGKPTMTRLKSDGDREGLARLPALNIVQWIVKRVRRVKAENMRNLAA